MPDHPHEHDQVFTNPNKACERYQYISIPLQPEKVTKLSEHHAGLIPIEEDIWSIVQGSSMQRTGLGSIGTAVTGAAFFNDWSDPNGKVAMAFEVSCPVFIDHYIEIEYIFGYLDIIIIVFQIWFYILFSILEALILNSTDVLKSI